MNLDEILTELRGHFIRREVVEAVRAMGTEIERLRAELEWCHEGLTTAHEKIHPGVPVPDWRTMYASWCDIEAGRYDVWERDRQQAEHDAAEAAKEEG